jgi:hypothetical protein
LCRYKPFLTVQDTDGINSVVLLLMLITNRISHVNLALVQCRGLLKLLKTYKDASNEVTRLRLKKEMLSQADVLAATLSSKRFYTRKVASGQYEIDPRFLLFEYCHGLLLRQSQVVLIRRLLEDMAANRSVCHQMIMGAGKTTVVGPLLAMLLANANTLIFEVVPPALLDFSAGVLRERFGAAIKKPVFTFNFDRYQKVRGG